MRLIDADKLEPHEIYDGHGFTEVVYMDDIREMSTVDAEPIRHGKWLTKEYVYGIGDHEDEWVESLAVYGDCAYCSVCGGYAGLDGGEEYALTPYCPHCGAMMDEVE